MTTNKVRTQAGLPKPPPNPEGKPGPATPLRRWAWLRRWGQRLTGVVAAGAVLGLNALGTWQPLERLGYTLLFELREYSGLLPNPGWDERIAVIAIDEATLQHYGQFPLSRDRYAELLQQLAYVQPAAIGVDLLLTDPSPQDHQLGQGIYQNGNLVLAIDIHYQGPGLPIAPDIQRAAAGAFWVGHSNYSPDIDGISRQVPLYQGGTPALALALADMYQLTQANTLTALDGPVETTATPANLTARPADYSLPPTLTINWPGQIITASQPSTAKAPKTNQARPLTIYSMIDVLEERVDPQVFKNQIVLVGLATAGTKGVRSPLNRDPPVAGVVFHAAIVDNLLNRRWLRPLPPKGLALLLLVIGLLTSLSFRNQRLQTRILFGLMLSGGWLLIVIVAFAHYLWLPLVAPMATLLLTLGGRHLQEQWEGQQLMNLFAMCVAPEMADLIWQQRGEILHHGRLPAQELIATVMFVDIRGFTGIAQTLSKQQLLDWLNRYFAVMTACIMEHGGVVDKYIGDAIMAVFGMPFPRTSPEQIQQDAIAAVATSLAIQKKVDLLNQTLPAEGIPIPPFTIGIGLHTGPVVAGSVGNHQRVSYSVFGDTVNIAARLEKLTKQLPPQLRNRVLMTDSTALLIQARYPTLPCGHLLLEGRQVETALFAIDDDPNSG
ncbi:MAG: CHASE2 domain-containing protein [Nodosilinea sp.]